MNLLLKINFITIAKTSLSSFYFEFQFEWEIKLNYPNFSRSHRLQTSHYGHVSFQVITVNFSFFWRLADISAIDTTLNNVHIYMHIMNINILQDSFINDPLGQTHSHISSEHCFLLFCFSRFEKWGRTDDPCEKSDHYHRVWVGI